MKNILIIVGSKSHVLKDFSPKKDYQEIISADKSNSSNKINRYKNIEYDLLNKKKYDYENIINYLKPKDFDNIDIIFSSFCSKGLNHLDSKKDISDGLYANIAKPLSLFSYLSEEFKEKKINGVFISSIYSTVSPNPSNYENESDINPLFYGASKAAVNQGLKWLSTRNKNHKFNSLILGAMPKDKVIENNKFLVDRLIKSIPSKKFVSFEELNRTLNFMLDNYCDSLRGTSVILDGGYTIW